MRFSSLLFQRYNVMKKDLSILVSHWNWCLFSFKRERFHCRQRLLISSCSTKYNAWYYTIFIFIHSFLALSRHVRTEIKKLNKTKQKNVCALFFIINGSLFGFVVVPFISLMSYKYGYYIRVIFKLTLTVGSTDTLFLAHIFLLLVIAFEPGNPRALLFLLALALMCSLFLFVFSVCFSFRLSGIDFIGVLWRVNIFYNYCC